MAVWTHECLETETIELRPISDDLKLPTACLMDCTMMTYNKKLQIQDQRNIRFTDCTQENLGEYCWSTSLKCTAGESFQHAFVVLPVDTTVSEQVEVKTSATATSLSPHSSPTTIAESCGLQYDVTSHFSTENRGTSFCIHVHSDRGPRCLPYLVTFWQRGNQVQQQTTTRKTCFVPVQTSWIKEWDIFLILQFCPNALYLLMTSILWPRWIDSTINNTTSHTLYINIIIIIIILLFYYFIVII